MLSATDEELITKLGRWYIPRRDPRYLRRNALLALGNSADPADAEVRSVVHRFVSSEDEMLSEHAQWAHERLEGRAQVAT
jgi:epoxyqueuosine reductase